MDVNEIALQNVKLGVDGSNKDASYVQATQTQYIAEDNILSKKIAAHNKKLMDGMNEAFAKGDKEAFAAHHSNLSKFQADCEGGKEEEINKHFASAEPKEDKVEKLSAEVGGLKTILNKLMELDVVKLAMGGTKSPEAAEEKSEVKDLRKIESIVSEMLKEHLNGGK